jgi:hypothetical protein
MPRIKSKPFHNEYYILLKIQNLPNVLIYLIYRYINGKVKVIFNPKWNWFLNNIYEKYERSKQLEFNIKLKILLNNLDCINLNYFYNSLFKNSAFKNYFIGLKLQEEKFNYKNKQELFDLIINFIYLTFSKYALYKKSILENNNEIKENKFLINWKLEEEKKNFCSIPKINEVIILCKSILFIYSKLCND